MTQKVAKKYNEGNARVHHLSPTTHKNTPACEKTHNNTRGGGGDSFNAVFVDCGVSAVSSPCHSSWAHLLRTVTDSDERRKQPTAVAQQHSAGSRNSKRLPTAVPNVFNKGTPIAMHVSVIYYWCYGQKKVHYYNTAVRYANISITTKSALYMGINRRAWTNQCTSTHNTPPSGKKKGKEKKGYARILLP